MHNISLIRNLIPYVRTPRTVDFAFFSESETWTHFYTCSRLSTFPKIKIEIRCTGCTGVPNVISFFFVFSLSEPCVQSGHNKKVVVKTNSPLPDAHHHRRCPRSPCLLRRQQATQAHDTGGDPPQARRPDCEQRAGERRAVDPHQLLARGKVVVSHVPQHVRIIPAQPRGERDCWFCFRDWMCGHVVRMHQVLQHALPVAPAGACLPPADEAAEREVRALHLRLRRRRVRLRADVLEVGLGHRLLEQAALEGGVVVRLEHAAEPVSIRHNNFLGAVVLCSWVARMREVRGRKALPQKRAPISWVLLVLGRVGGCWYFAVFSGACVIYRVVVPVTHRVAGTWSCRGVVHGVCCQHALA